MEVKLRRFTEKDIPDKVRWINDEKNNAFLHYPLPLEIEKTKEWYEKTKGRKDRYDAVITADGVVVGLIGLLSIDNGQGELYILVGEAAYKGKGVAKAAVTTLLKKAFFDMGLSEVYLYTETGNLAAQGLFEKLGFIRIREIKNSAINRGKPVDRILYEYHRNPPREEATPLYQLGVILNNDIYIKREDLLAFSFGGNKARKAMLYWKDMKRSHVDSVVTYGSVSSNHCRVTANLAAREGLSCVIISPREMLPTMNNNWKMTELFGASHVECEVENVRETIDNVLESLKRKGRNPYFIMGGGHGTIGTQAYVNCYKEIREYEKQSGKIFDHVFTASGTGSTQAGLICGLLLEGTETRVIGISVARKSEYGSRVIGESVRKYVGSRYPIEEIQKRIELVDDYTGGGYGKTNGEIDATIQSALCRYGIGLDHTYTGKAFYGMEQYIKRYGLKGKRILFIHTGGTPLYFDDLERMYEEWK